MTDWTGTWVVLNLSNMAVAVWVNAYLLFHLARQVGRIATALEARNAREGIWRR